MTEVISTEKYKIIYSEEPRCKIIYRDSEITVISINGVRIGKYQNSTDADTVDNFHASSIPLPNTLLALNSDSKLPTSITGDADTLDGHHSTDFASFSHNHSKSDITDLETITTTPTAYAIPKAGSDGKLDSDWISGVGGGGDADTVDGFHASSTPQAGKLLALDSGAKLPASITGDADTVDGQHASSFAPASHTHTKSAVTDLETITTTPTASAVPKADSSGKIAAGWLATGSGSGLDADKLDGQHASAFASASHNHDSSYVMLTDYEDADVLAKIKNVDGAGSGLDADLLDGQHAAAFATASHTHSKSAITDLETITATPTAYAIPKAGSDGKLDSGWIPSGGGGGDADTVDGFHASSTPQASKLLALDSNAKLPTSITGDADTVDGQHASAFATASHNHDTAYVKLDDYEDADVLAKIKNVDGSGSGLDADLLDGQHAAAFAAASHTHTKSNITDLETITATPTAYAVPKAGADGKIDSGWIPSGGGGGDADTVDGFHASATPQAGKLLALDSNAKLPASITGDADTVDGQHASAFAAASHNHDSTYVKLSDYDDEDVLAKVKNVDGSGSGLDADLLDGQHASSFAASSHTHTKSAITDLETITTTPTAHAVPKADSGGKLSNSWLKTGSGQGLDADTVDGYHASGLFCLDQVNVVTGGRSGSEGGEMRLAVPQSGHSLAGDVVIDVSGNKLRFFENGGSNRGAYIDLTECAASVGTKLGGTNVTVQRITGTIESAQTSTTHTISEVDLNKTFATISFRATDSGHAYALAQISLDTTSVTVRRYYANSNTVSYTVFIVSFS